MFGITRFSATGPGTANMERRILMPAGTRDIR